MAKELGAAPLSNPKHEKMMQLLAGGGIGLTDAHARAGFKKDSGNAAHVMARPECEARLGWLQARMSEKIVDQVVQVAAKVSHTREWVIERLQLNARIAMGEQTIIVKKVTRDDRQIVLVETQRDAQAANRALQLLGLELGMFRTEVPAPPPEDVDAARSARDPKIAQQLERYASKKPRLIAKDGVTVPAKRA